MKTEFEVTIYAGEHDTIEDVERELTRVLGRIGYTFDVNRDSVDLDEENTPEGILEIGPGKSFKVKDQAPEGEGE